MNYAQYNAEEARNEVAFAVTFILLMRAHQDDELQEWQWYSILEAYFQVVSAYRYESGRLARRFYDDERRRVLTTPVDPPSSRSVFVSGPGGTSQRNVFAGRSGLTLDLDLLEPIVTPPRHNFNVNPYNPRIFTENMEPHRVEFSEANASDQALQRVVDRATKEVSMGGRRTMLGGVKTDPKVVGWARVAGGGESCGFCAMLISRGPVYTGARGFRRAGSMARDELDAISAWRAFERTGNDAEILALMNKWHPNCDCRVVPVFDRENWPGRDEYLRAEELWKDVTSRYKGGKGGGDKLLAFRRALGDGYKNPAPIKL